MRRQLILFILLGLFISTIAFSQDKPNILVIWGDDIGQSNISAYTMGLVGYRTPNIDRVAKEGMIFTDYYGEQSCTAGRSSTFPVRVFTERDYQKLDFRAPTSECRWKIPQ